MTSRQSSEIRANLENIQEVRASENPPDIAQPLPVTGFGSFSSVQLSVRECNTHQLLYSIANTSFRAASQLHIEAPRFFSQQALICNLRGLSVWSRRYQAPPQTRVFKVAFFTQCPTQRTQLPRHMSKRTSPSVQTALGPQLMRLACILRG